MSEGPHYTALQDPATGRWFYTWPGGGRCSGWKFKGSCQQQADKDKAKLKPATTKR